MKFGAETAQFDEFEGSRTTLIHRIAQSRVSY
jgi:hypothetical protein